MLPRADVRAMRSRSNGVKTLSGSAVLSLGGGGAPDEEGLCAAATRRRVRW